MSSVLKKIYQVLLKTETGLLVGLLIMMITIAVIQIFMRNFMGAGLIWAESLLRIIVLWLALLGAMVASRNGEHIAIDVLINKLPEKFRRLMIRLVRISTSCICFVVAGYGLKFVVDEYEYGGIAFGFVPHWACEAIIPVALFIIAIRYLVAGILLDEPKVEG
jgi:TRAP-type C4-dicarboxylate transport system permease small subunit